MKAFIRITDHVEQKAVCNIPYEEEINSQNMFDDATEFGWNEWAGRYELALIVEHPTLGEITRRSMFTNNLQGNKAIKTKTICHV